MGICFNVRSALQITTCLSSLLCKGNEEGNYHLGSVESASSTPSCLCFPLKTENTDTMQKQGELVSVKSAEWDIVFHESKNVSLHAAALN